MITVEFYLSTRKSRDWRWRIIAENRLVLADSGQGYSRRIDAVRGAELVIGQTIDAPARGAFTFTVQR